MKTLLNVGGGSKQIPIPPWYDGWRHDLLDIDPRGGADIVMDARDLHDHTAGVYDAIYCAHNLEHYHRHDGVKVLRGFHHVLKPDGFVEIRVPNLANLFQEVVRRNLDLDDVFYVSAAGPILVRDMIYGYHVEIERSGQDFFSHKTGFTAKSLQDFVQVHGFPHNLIGQSSPIELVGFFFKQYPTSDQMRMIRALPGQ